MPAPTVAFGLYESIYHYLQTQGISEREVCEALGIKNKQEGALFGRVPLSLYEHAMIAAEMLTGDAAVGFHMGKTALPATFGVFYLLSIAGDDLTKIVAAIARYFPLMYDFISLNMNVDSEKLSIEFNYAQHRRPHRHVVEHIFSGWYTTADQLNFDEEKVPRTLYLAQNNYCAESVLKSIFHQTPVHFDQPEDRFVLHINQWQQQHSSQAPENTRIFDSSEKAAAHSMLRLRASDRIAQEISTHVEALLPEGLPTIEDVAQRMKCSGRTLQRRLAERHLQYQMLLDRVREDIAITLLTTTTLPITQIATRVGFTSDSTFHRAFKRWTGVLPGSYRQSYR